MPKLSAAARPAALLLALALGGCDPRDCWLGIAHGDCHPEGSALAQFPQDDAICREYGLRPESHDYAICRQTKLHERALTERESDFSPLQNPLIPDAKVLVPVQPPAPQ